MWFSILPLLMIRLSILIGNIWQPEWLHINFVVTCVVDRHLTIIFSQQTHFKAINDLLYEYIRDGSVKCLTIKIIQHFDPINSHEQQIGGGTTTRTMKWVGDGQQEDRQTILRTLPPAIQDINGMEMVS